MSPVRVLGPSQMHYPSLQCFYDGRTGPFVPTPAQGKILSLASLRAPVHSRRRPLRLRRNTADSVYERNVHRQFQQRSRCNGTPITTQVFRRRTHDSRPAMLRDTAPCYRRSISPSQSGAPVTIRDPTAAYVDTTAKPLKNTDCSALGNHVHDSFLRVGTGHPHRKRQAHRQLDLRGRA